MLHAFFHLFNKKWHGFCIYVGNYEPFMKTDTTYTLRLIKTTLVILLLTGFKVFAQAPFITVWKTDTTYLGTSGISTNTQIQIPATGTFSYTWERVGTPAGTGSGTGSGATTITFPSAGKYRVRITPTGTTAAQFKRFAFTAPSPSSDAIKLIGVEQWGDILWNNMDYAFSGTSNLTSIIAPDTPNLSNVTTMREMFSYAVKLTSVAGINNWDVSNVITMRSMFQEANVFNSNIGNWNTGNVRNTQDMFNGAIAFNQPIGNWNVSKDTTMYRMFQTASAFNQNIGSWMVDSVINMGSMFKSALAFNQNISGWNVSKVKRMDFMFNQASAFNQPIGIWNVSSDTTMNSMFFNAHVFNQQLSSWNLINVLNVTDMFRRTALSCSNYSNTLIGWAANPNTPNGRSLTNNTLSADGSAIKYSTDGQTARNTLTSTKGWTISGDSYDPSCLTMPLEVKLSAFTVKQQNGNALLQWTTASEQSNNGFEIQRSTDGINWEKISFSYSKAIDGNSNTVLRYDYTDGFPFAGTNYYRLKQMATNGASEYSNIVMLNFGSNVTPVHVYPNPVKSVLNIETKGNDRIVIVNAVGQVMLNKTISEVASIQTVDCSGWAKGIYFVRITDNSGMLSTQKIVKD